MSLLRQEKLLLLFFFRVLKLLLSALNILLSTQFHSTIFIVLIRHLIKTEVMFKQLKLQTINEALKYWQVVDGV